MAPGRCPECGRGWTLEEFRYIPGRVRFLCPHCDHAYAGLGPEGRPWPPSFDCRACGKRVTHDMMRALPAPGMSTEQVMGNIHPWIERARIGRWRAFWRTLRGSLVGPRDLGGALPAQAQVRDALAFSAWVSAITLVFPLTCMGFSLIPALIAAPGAALSSWETTVMLGTALGLIATRPVLALVQASVAHLVLRWTGPVRSGWSLTACACLYGLGPIVADAVPCISCVSPVGTVWSIVSSITQLQSAQGVSAGRASLALLLLPGLAIAAAIILVLWFYGSGGTGP
jgi:hypothetical protein